MNKILLLGMLASTLMLSADHGGDFSGETATLDGPEPEASDEPAGDENPFPDEAPTDPAPETSQAFVIPATPPVVETAPVAIKKLILDAGTQPRVAIDEDVVNEYTQAIKDAQKNEQPIPLPAITVFRDSEGKCVVADGFHRIAAHRAAGLKEIECEIRDGTAFDALLFSLGANVTHGVRRSNRDKQRAVKIAFSDTNLSTLSDSEIARICGVSSPMVAQHRPAAKAVTTRTITRNGKAATMDVSAIGKGKSAKAKAKAKKEEAAAKKAAAKSAKKGDPEAPAPAKAPESKKQDEAVELDKLLNKVVDNVGADQGGKFRAAVLDGSLALNLKDVKELAGFDKAKQKAVLPLIVGGPRMKPAKAFDFITGEVPEKILSELHNRALGSNGKFVLEGEGFTLTYKIEKKTEAAK